MLDVLQNFQFLRPAWLLAVPVVLALWYLIRPRKRVEAGLPDGIAPHLAEALRVGGNAARRIYPIDGVMITALLLALAVAGPAWDRVPNPLVSETAPLVVALKVTESMANTDLAPTRLDRARFKILDLVASRAGARTALVAYAGSAHRVSPLTEDPNILRPLLEGLTPEVMPNPGSNAGDALELAIEILNDAEAPGAILFVLDDLDPSDLSTLNAERDPPRPPIVFLATVPDSVPIAQLDQVTDATVVRLTPDDRDIEAIERKMRSVQEETLRGDERLAWNDRGWWFVWPAALLTLLWFRRGWTMRWGVVLAVLIGMQSPTPARAEGWIDWFLTADQQGWLAFEDKNFAEAADLFQDPMWNGYAKYRAGQYVDAIGVFDKIATAEAAFAQGMAQIKNREYRPAVRSFETALERQPDFPEAARNLEVANAIVEYVETAREQSDTGEESGIGADDIVFDNEASRGAETQIDAPKEDAAPLTSDQWMQSIDTDMGDFLRSRFLLDSAGESG